MAQALATTARFGLGVRRGVAHETLRSGRVVLAAAVALTALGLVMLYSSSSSRSVATGADTFAALERQVRWAFLGALAGWGASRASLKWLRSVARPALLLSLVLLTLTLVVGRTTNGSARWLSLFGLNVQPSELLKIAALLYLADRLAARDDDSAFGDRTPILAMLAPVGIGTFLVLVEPDLGTSLFIVAQSVVLLALAGVRPTRLLPFVAAATPLIVVYAYTRFAHVSRRWAAFLTQEEGSQARESLVAIGSGGLLGRGLGEGTQKLFYVPESNTDFIFAVIGEELGFLACAGIVLAYMTIVWHGRRIAWRARALGTHAYYLAAGATFIVTFQALVNLAVVTATVPTKGVSLPFISMGGSNLMMACVAIGLVVNVSRRVAAASGDDPWC
jgi:cell division protein FtsW